MLPARIFLPTVILVLVFGLASAQDDTLKFSLQEAQDFAIQNNVTVENARLDQKITKKRTVEIISEGLPKFDAIAAYKNNFELATTVTSSSSFRSPQDPPAEETLLPLKFGTQHNMNIDFQVTEMLLEGRYFIGLKANKTLLAISREQLEITESDLKNMVAKSYYAALVAEESVAIIEKNLETVSKLLSDTKELYKNGFLDELSVDRLELSLANLESRQKDIKQQLAISQDVLKYQLGLTFDKNISLTDNLESLLAQTTDVTDTGFDFTKRNEYQLLNHEKTVRGYEASSYSANYSPSLSAFFGYGFNAQRVEFDVFKTGQPWYRSGYFGFQIKWQIFDSFKNGAIYQQKKLEQEKIKNNIRNFEQQANLQVKTAQSDYQNATEQFANQKKNMALAEKIYNKTKIMYEEGVGSSSELAQSESDLTEIQSNYINAMYNLLAKRSDLMKALGNY